MCSSCIAHDEHICSTFVGQLFSHVGAYPHALRSLLITNEGLQKHFRDEAKNMETLKDLMVENGDDKSRIFYLKVIS